MSCPACFAGHINPGTPKGRVETIHGLITYVAEPDEGTQAKGIIIMIPDAFGLPLANNRIWADNIASAGDYRVYLPDFMGGNAAPVAMIDTMNNLMSEKTSLFWKPVLAVQLISSFIPFLYANRWSVCWPRITSFFKSVRENEGASLPIGAAGFCWGGRHLIYLAHDQEKASNGKPLIDAGFTAHPSSLSLPTEIEKIQKPVSLAIGDKDFQLSVKHVDQIKKIWAGKENVETEVVLYKDAAHGFSIRVDTATKDAAEKAKDAEKQAVDWYKKEFAKVSY